ncbi:hypothetical protein DPMN_062615 [Dreissena polymorpha]|uniref:Uncharacterized protein n=1 Tax=Dreissena polymorpha TaxID=45954 RepID=A0A9D4CA62_DREPO|nr:hypothetical protein DPMN_062615 [Dreissena polymorpha]
MQKIFKLINLSYSQNRSSGVSLLRERLFWQPGSEMDYIHRKELTHCTVYKKLCCEQESVKADGKESKIAGFERVLTLQTASDTPAQVLSNTFSLSLCTL